MKPLHDDVVALDGVRKVFAKTIAVDDLDLHAPAGAITILLGPNGAGKSTILRLVTGALPADGGRVETLGRDPVADGSEVRRRCGVVSAHPALYERLDGWENLRYAARLFGASDARTHLAATAERFDIADALDKKVAGYSTGMKTRLALARAILHDPELLLLDEPTSGLDPESAQAVLKLIRELTGSGRSVVMATHHLVEAEGLADRVVVLDRGHALAAGTPDELARNLWPAPRIVFDADRGDLLDTVAGRPGVLAYSRNGTANVTVDDLGRVPDLVDHLVGLGARLTRVEPVRSSLEDLYFELRRRERAGAPTPTGDSPPTPVGAPS